MTDYNCIPDFLKMTAEERKKAWKGVPVTDPYQHHLPANSRGIPVAEAEQAKRKAKNKKNFERMMEAHEGEYYDRRKKQWLPRKDE